MRNRDLSREKALEEYLIYRKRVREILDLGQIASDINKRKYKPSDLSGRGPERFSVALSDVLVGWFASLMDKQGSALNVFDVWLALFPTKKDKIAETWERVRPLVQLIREYRNDVVCHANKGVHRYIETHRSFYTKLGEIHAAMQAVMNLAAELMRDEPTVLPNLRADIDPILRAMFPDDGQIEDLKDYFLQKERTAD